MEVYYYDWNLHHTQTFQGTRRPVPGLHICMSSTELRWVTEIGAVRYTPAYGGSLRPRVEVHYPPNHALNHNCRSIYPRCHQCPVFGGFYGDTQDYVYGHELGLDTTEDDRLLYEAWARSGGGGGYRDHQRRDHEIIVTMCKGIEKRFIARRLEQEAVGSGGARS